MSTATTQWQTPGEEGGLRARRGEAALLDQPQLCGVGNGDRFRSWLWYLSLGWPLPLLRLRPFTNDEGLGPQLPALCI